MLNTTPSAKEKTRALDLALQQIEKQFGKGAIMKLGDEEITPIDVIPTGSINKSNTTVIFINQIRMQIGVMFGSPETTAGGRALKFYASVRLDIRRIGSIKRGEEVVGNETRVKVVKNKIAPPFREALFDILYGEGISREGDVLDLAVLHNIVDKSGAWYSYQGERIGQGRENVRAFLKENKDVFARVDGELRKKLGIAGVASADVPPVPADGPVQAKEAVRGKK